MVDLSARLEAAALLLAGAGTIKDRLIDAYRKHLADLHDTDVPGDVQQEFAQMIQVLHSVRALPGDDVVKASVRKLSNEQAHQYAGLVVRLYGQLAGLRGPLGVRAPARAVTPLTKLLAVESAAVNS
jgi:hypothetical protein